MSYNKYTPHKAQRYNSPGTFIPAGSFGGGPQRGFGNMGPPRQPEPVLAFNKPISQNSEPNIQTPMNPPPQAPPQLLETPTEQESMETNHEAKVDEADADVPGKPFWMKSKLVGVKKISNKERRRRQNENLRRLLTPKNALMVLNEIMSGEQLANVCAVSGGAQYYKPAQSSFCAELGVDGHVYMGYGETKMVARNNAAEQAIRDLMIKRMGKLFAEAAGDHGDASQGGPVAIEEGTNSVPGVAEGEGEKEAAEALPMIQLASYALHKLFTEWECEGHKVPQLKPHTVSLPYNVGTKTALCTAKRAAVLTFRRLINAAKSPLTLLPAAIRLSTSISYLPSMLNILPKYTSSFTCSNILSFTLILHSVLSSFLNS